MLQSQFPFISHLYNLTKIRNFILYVIQDFVLLGCDITEERRSQFNSCSSIRFWFSTYRRFYDFLTSELVNFFQTHRRQSPPQFFYFTILTTGDFHNISALIVPYSYRQQTRCNSNGLLIILNSSTSFGQLFCPSSGALDCVLQLVV